MAKKNPKAAQAASTMSILLGGANSAATNPELNVATDGDADKTLTPASEVLPGLPAADENNGAQSGDSNTAFDGEVSGSEADISTGDGEQRGYKKRGPKPNPGAEKSVRCTYMINKSHADNIDAVSNITRKSIKDIVTEAFEDYFIKHSELVKYCLQERDRLSKALKKKGFN